MNPKARSYSEVCHDPRSTADTATAATMGKVSMEAARVAVDWESLSSTVQKSPAAVSGQVHPKSVQIPTPPQTIPSNMQNTAGPSERKRKLMLQCFTQRSATFRRKEGHSKARTC